MRRVAFTILTSLLLAYLTAIASGSSFVTTATITVPDDYPTIRAALTAASDGDTIFVRSGIYYEGLLLVNRSLSLTGEGQETTIIDGSHMWTPIIEITASNVTVKGFTIRNSGYVYGWMGGGIWIKHSNRNTITENTINSTQYGINLDHSSENVIVNNTLIENDYGIHFMYDSNNSVIYHNNFIRNLRHLDYFSSPASCQHTWDNGSEGNFWQDYPGSDWDGDGVGDTHLPWGGVDYYPLMTPYSWWLAADINFDFTVNLFDIVVAAQAYGSTPSMENWNPAADLAPIYGRIDIFDCVTIAYSFGKSRS